MISVLFQDSFSAKYPKNIYIHQKQWKFTKIIMLPFKFLDQWNKMILRSKHINFTSKCYTHVYRNVPLEIILRFLKS